jgi:hypothetical protein
MPGGVAHEPAEGEGVVIFRGGQVVQRAAVDWIQDVERRGGLVTLLGTGEWRVTPPGILTLSDLRFVCSDSRWVQVYWAVAWLSDESCWFLD